MLDVLDDYLKDATTPELRDSISEAHDAFDLLGLEDYDYAFNEIIMMANNDASGDTVMRIVALTREMQKEVIGRFAVKVTDDISVEHATILINGIALLPGYENQVEVFRIAQLPLCPEERFAEMIALVTSESVDHILTFVKSVSEAFVERVKDNASGAEKVDITPEQIAFRNDRIEVFKALQGFLMKPIVFVARMLTDGMDVGLPFMMYAYSIGRKFESMNPEIAAEELVAMALLSADGRDRPAAIIHENLENLVFDTEKITKIDIAVTNILLRFKGHEQK